jgi:hypothetical protein
MHRAAGVTFIAAIFFLAAAYLGALGAILLLSPGFVSLTLGAPLLFGLELAGPYMFMLAAAVSAFIGWGLLRLHRWARWAAMAVAFVGFVMLVPSLSAAAVDFRWSLLWTGLGATLRVGVIWYLWQEPVAEEFGK